MADDAEFDDNAEPTMIGVDKDDEDAPAKIAVNPATGAVIVEVEEE